MVPTRREPDPGLFGGYALTGFDEMFAEPERPRPLYQALAARLAQLTAEDIDHRHQVADLVMRRQGITFTVYGREGGLEQIIPFDPIPRLISADEWATRRARARAAGPRAERLRPRRLPRPPDPQATASCPAELVVGASGYRRECVGLRVPRDIYIHISGIDLIRDETGRFLVLEDNARTPSGVSYVLNNRQVMKQVFPFLFQQYNVRPIDDYAGEPAGDAPRHRPGRPRRPDRRGPDARVYNSAYFEHSFLARQMGVELVEGRDLFFDAGQIFMRTTRGPRRVDVLYRRVDDQFLDPLAFRRDSVLGVAGPLRGPADRAASAWPTRSGPASATTRRSILTSRRSSATTCARTRSSATSRRSA